MSDLFIWYHAPASIEHDLLQWLEQLSKQGIRGRLFVRHETEQTTFMEVYESVGSGTLDAIETEARQQPWYRHLRSPRRCESFKEISSHE
ncbi:MAG: hypothetical protein ACE5F3_00785 [Mariprofundaceae bacterium]